MCYDDRMYGRSSGARYVAVTVGTTPVPLVAPNPNRLALMISSPIGAHMTIGPDPLISDLVGLVLFSSQPPMVFDVYHHGDMVTGGLYGVLNIGSGTIGVVEVIGELE